MKEQKRYQKPLECIDCQKNPSVCYKTVVNGQRKTQTLCSQCPVLLKRIKGIQDLEDELLHEFFESGISCDNCHTDIGQIIKDQRLGCMQCYSLFEELILQELVHKGFIASHPTHADASNPNLNLHIGKAPKSECTLYLTNRLESLNHALKDALKIENYEEAANLRDEIKQMIKRKNET